MDNNPPSYLSENVHDLLINLRFLHSCTYDVIDEHTFFDWNNVENELEHISDGDSILDNSWNWYRNKVELLWGIMIMADEKFKVNSDSVRDNLFTLSSWIFDFSEIEDIYKKFKTNGESELLFCVLKLTSHLDRALGDVYTSSSDHVPFLLKDMLASSVLSEVFGRTQIKFLQLLLGTVRGLNVRNIAWHGFFSPGELHRSIVSTLFLVIASLGISLKNFERRPTIKYDTLKNYIPYLDPLFYGITFDSVKFLEAVMNCPFISKSHWDYWKYACHLYFKGCFGDSLIFLFPLKENLLRSIFCYANDCSARVLTAEATAFYTTMDDILAPTLGSAGNRLDRVIGMKILEMLLDLYIYEEGPRLRDRISHSEIKAYDVPEDIARRVFDTSILLLLVSTNGKHVKLNENEVVLNSEYNSQHIDITLKYETQFHPTCLFKRSLIHIISKVVHWKKFPTPPELTHLFDNEYNKVVDLFKMLTGYNNFIKYSSDTTAEIINLKPATIYRPKYELELISTLRKIVSCLEILNANIVESCETKYLLWDKKQLKSRNRENYKRMLDCISSLQFGIGCLFHTMFITLKKLNNYNIEEVKIVQRFFRICQKYTENASSMSSVKKNRWKELKDSTFNICNDIAAEPLVNS